MGPPLSKSSREKFKEAVERRFPNEEDRVKFIANGAGLFIDKGLGLLTYDALLAAIYLRLATNKVCATASPLDALHSSTSAPPRPTPAPA